MKIENRIFDIIKKRNPENTGKKFTQKGLIIKYLCLNSKIIRTQDREKLIKSLKTRKTKTQKDTIHL